MTEPDPKRQKLEVLPCVGKEQKDDEEKRTPDELEIGNVIRAMKSSPNNLNPVLGDEFSEDLPKINVYVGTVREKKFIHKVIVSLNTLLPLPELQHLKRARNTEMLICPSDVIAIEDLILSLSDKGFDLKAHLKEDFKIVSVISKPPLLKRQHKMAHDIWPCNFHPNKHNEQLVSGNFFSKDDVKKHRKYMALAYEVAEIYDRIKNKLDVTMKDMKQCDFVDASIESSNSRQQADDLKIDKSLKSELTKLKGVVIVDPSIDSIVAVGYDRRSVNPCQHPIMLAIDNVAKSQHGGAWKDESLSVEEDSDAANEELIMEGVPKMFRNILKARHGELKFGAKRTIRRCDVQTKSISEKSEVMKADKEDADSKQLKECDFVKPKEDEKTDSAVSKKPIAADVSLDDKPSGPYLCTGYEVYTTTEPCIMCSMALVHSRAKRVMFAMKNAENGALNSISKLHTISALNHHYDVFTGFFEDL